MSTGRNNKLAGQIGEYLVCAELGRRNLIATPFSGNVPTFDVLATDARCRTVPIQVKATRSDSWRSDARTWMQISLDKESGIQVSCGASQLTNPELIYVHVVIAPPDGSKDRFFILTKRELQAICIERYSNWMGGHGCKRPRTQDSFDCRYRVSDVQGYEGNWKLIDDRLATSSPDQSLESDEDE